MTSPINYTLTYFSDHVKGLSHDQINRYLKKADITSADLWANVQESIVLDPGGFIAFDDTVLDKRHSFKIESVKKQWSGNEHRAIKGIGIVTCVYVNPKTGQFWAIDYRIYDPEVDNKNKLQHVRDMLDGIVKDKKLPFSTVLMDSWYAERKLMLHIGDTLKKTYYTVAKKNRLVAEHRGEHAYQKIETLDWTEEEKIHGKRIRLNDFPNEHKVQLFHVPVLPERMDYVVTNDLTQDNSLAVRAICKIRWKIEEFHRELKQFTGIESCQCRKAKIQKNHIGSAMLVWARLKNLAYQTGQNAYALYKSQFDDMITKLLEKPVIQMTINKPA